MKEKEIKRLKCYCDIEYCGKGEFTTELSASNCICSDGIKTIEIEDLVGFKEIDKLKEVI
ncbi:MAG: hypothetical protein QXL18_05145 [Candidatus Woesearchaeota archaeon]